ncbi:methanol O-anthraniloyltransferase-like [Ipomoea triloba]|uniref:methanol O-anthraniloyltransferase-like n=1 Tax=Ipomoea triloba TaxID=35885 RepID=UPI00125D603E|nr:methanol O-anthraniloyltransferase-like [Ipomoea triloba]
MARKQAFVVSHKEPQLLVPSKPTPHEIKELSDIDDQKGMRIHVSMIMFFRANPLMKARDAVEAIRGALAEALVWYYPLAGRIIHGPDEDKFMVDCSGEGILFVKADSNFSLEDLGDAIKPPCLYSKELLYQVPGSDGILGCPLLLVQVTRLICGGFVVAIRLNHVITDGLGLAKFLKATGELAQGASSPSIKPIWRRELLTAKNLPPRTRYEHPEYNVVGHENDTKMDEKNVVGRGFYFGPNEIKAIRQKLAQPTSKFNMITASIWRSRTRALNLTGDETVAITTMVNVSDKTPLAPLQKGFYGNAAVPAAAVTGARMLSSNPLGYAIDLIQKAKDKVGEDYVRSMVNLMNEKGKPQILRSRCNIVVSDASKAGFDRVDFGWGKPVYGGTMDGGSATLSIYGCCRNVDGEEGVVVPVFLPPPAMERFEREMERLTSLEFGESLISKSNL